MNKKTSIGILLTLILTLICCIAMPTSAYALTADEVNDAAGKSNYYINPNDSSEHWFRSDKAWHRCDVVDSSNNLSEVTNAVRSAMINREKGVSLYIAVNNSNFASKDNTTEASNQLATKTLKAVTDNIYRIDSMTDNTLKAKSGDYLKFNCKIKAKSCSRFPTASIEGEYNYYLLELSFDNLTTANQEKAIERFVEQWQSRFITNNSVIKNTLNQNEKEYYITKTIYNFAVLNTMYDYSVYSGIIGNDTQQYKNSHSAYGAIFGNTKNADGYVDDTVYNWETTLDSQGLTRIANNSQGLSVCDGYSLLTYYLCQLNGIECKIVEGDYTESSGLNSDPHAWNIIKLQDCDDEGQKWYYFDATFAENSTATIKLNEFSIIDYGYFLRGSQNNKFSEKEHQQMPAHPTEQSQSDYKLGKSAVECKDSWIVMSRRKSTTHLNEIENYFIISPDKKYYKINPSTNTLYECDKKMVYDGNEYYYNINIQDLANGIEYSCEDIKLKNAGSYTLTAHNNDSSMLYSLPITIDCLDMSSWSGYSKLMWNGDDIKGSSEDATSIEFTGNNISFSVEIYDVAKQLLTENINYTINFTDQSGNKINSSILPGAYFVVINFDANSTDNYCSEFKIAFNITKSNLGNFVINQLDNLYFGEDILAGCNSLSTNGITFYNGIDYTVSLENPSAINFGQDGYIIYTALPTSQYFVAGTQLKRYYKISQQLDLSNSFVGASVGAFQYTGTQIKPSNFSMTININGVNYALRENIDYIITSYSNNINPGTAYVTVQFIGNFCGYAQLSFTIADSSNQPAPPTNNNNNQSNKPSVDIKVGNELTYNGKKQSPATSITVNGKALTEGVDYIVSGVDYHPGIYECTITGQGAYSFLSHKTVVFVNPGNMTGVSASSYENKINIQWSPQGGICYYQVYIYDSKSKKWRMIATTNKSSITTNFAYVNGKKIPLKANTTYKFRVRAYYKASVNGEVYTKYSPYKTISVKASAKIKKAFYQKNNQR